MTLDEAREYENRKQAPIIHQNSFEEMGPIVSTWIDKDMETVNISYDKYNESTKTTHHTIAIPYQEYLSYIIAHRDLVKELYKDIVDKY